MTQGIVHIRRRTLGHEIMKSAVARPLKKIRNKLENGRVLPA
jgi:hypothetical protein